MAISRLLRSGVRAFRSGGFQRGSQFVRGASRRGIRHFRKFKKDKFKNLSSVNKRRLGQARQGVRRVGRLAKARTKEGVRLGRQGFQRARSSFERF